MFNQANGDNQVTKSHHAADRTLTREQARAFYDGFGARQDAQAFYEDAATDDLIAHADFEHAKSVLEFGCGTGRFALLLFERHLPDACTYRGVDVSSTMIALAEERLAPWRDRARTELSDGSIRLPVGDAAVDRIVSNYVLDLLSEDDIRTLVAEAQRVLRPGGLLCLASLTYGGTLPARAVSWMWRRLHALRPTLVGGCRPIRLLDYLPGQSWRVDYHHVVTRWCLSSEVVVAARLPGDESAEKTDAEATSTNEDAPPGQ